MTATAVDPLAVYDVREGSYQYEGFAAFRRWAAAQGMDINETYRIEIHSPSAPFARVFTYDRDKQGRRHLDPVTGDAARRAPFDQPISSMPPVEPLPARRVQ